MISLAGRVLKKDIKATAKLMRSIEQENPTAISELKLLYPNTGNSHIIGITGLPGSGKSTIIDALIDGFRQEKKTVGVIAVDPSSPFTGGSILGDRIRMQKHSSDDGIFIKSLPSKGWEGGISKVTSKIVTVLDAMGKDIILVETVGVGQAEVAIKRIVHTTVVVLVGGLGDYIQVIKAGILEIADIFVINKIDKNNAEELEFNLKNLFGMYNNERAEDGKRWNPPVCLTEATSKKGIDNVARAIDAHKDQLETNGKFSRYYKDRPESELREILAENIINIFYEKFENDMVFKKMVSGVLAGTSDPYTAAEKIMEKLFNFKK